jgi:light-regulated signal transduction histidine kinase (bacteriophytochrome)
MIRALDISDEQKKIMLKEFKKTQKQIIRLDFQLKRTKNDREIAMNLMNKSIEDLEEKQNELATANQLLSKQKQLLEEQSKDLQNHLEQLEISYRELEQFSYIASHDLKSPLRSIAGFAQLLKRKYGSKLGEEADEYINFIVKATVHMNEVIRDLLEYSKMGKNTIEFEETNMNDMLESILEHLQAEIQQNNAIIEMGQMPILKIHKTGISQVFQNLISNAIKFRKDEAPHIKISAFLKNGLWQFSVSDNGIGLDESYQKKVFMPFQRIDNNKIKGTGIGLAICKKIVLLHKGNIWFESKIDQGTTFHFTIGNQIEQLDSLDA